MKKLLSVVLVLAMLASMMVYLPLGTAAVDPTPIFAEDFSEVEDGTYTWLDLSSYLPSWTMIRGNEEAEYFTVAGGVLTIDASSSETDIVLEMCTDAALKENHTVKYTKTQISYDSATKTAFSGIYTGTDTGEKTTAFIAKTNNEGYAHLALANGSINEGIHSSKGYIQSGAEALNQLNPDAVMYGGGYGKSTTATVYEVVYDVTGNQVDFYVSGARTLSTAGNPSMAAYKVADYVGEGAYLRVQKGRCSSFDDISILSGGTAVQDVMSGVVYEQDFNNIDYDPSTDSVQDLAEMIGFAGLLDDKPGSEAQINYDGVEYSITDAGQLDIFFPSTVAEGGGWSGWSVQRQFAGLYLPGMRYAQDTVVVEYDLTYTKTGDRTNEIACGDSPLWMQIYGRNNSYSVGWGNTQKNWINFRVYSKSKVFDTNMRPENMGHMINRATYSFANDNYPVNNMEKTNHYKVIMSKTEGVLLYVNDVLTWRLTDAQLATWGTGLGDLFGACNIRLLGVRGMHCTLDNLKVELDPAKTTPKLLITEVGASGLANVASGDSGSYEYAEIYNNSDSAVNIYDYAVIAQDWNQGRNTNVATSFTDLILAYPGAHTFKSQKKNESDGSSVYSITHTNPDYDGGWILPGEAVLLWNTTNAMHNGGVGNESAVEWNKTVDNFRTANSVPADVKVFMMYNDYNRSFNNSGSYSIGIVERAAYQPDYDPVTNTGDETLVSVTTHLKDYESYVYMTAQANLQSSNKDGANYHASANYIKRPVAATNNIPVASFRYENNANLGDVTMEGKLLKTGTANMNPGVVDDNQKRVINIVLNGTATEKYLGDVLNLTEAEGFEQLVYAEVNGVITQEASLTMTSVYEGAKINVKTIAFDTANKAYARLYESQTAGLRWITAIDAEALAALAEDERISNIEFGTLIAKGYDVEAGTTLTLDQVTVNNGEDGYQVRKVVATEGSWYQMDMETYNGLKLFAGGIGSLNKWNLGIDYVACGYLTMTVEGIGTVTIYGAAHTTNAVEDILTPAKAELETAGISSGAEYEAIVKNLNYAADPFN